MSIEVKLSEVQVDKPVTLIYHPGEVDVTMDRPDCIEISPEKTILCARSITSDEWFSLCGNEEFVRMFSFVWPELPLSNIPDLQVANLAIQHTVGLIVGTVVAIQYGKNPYWKFPETYLHPSQQLGLADLLIYLSEKPE